MPQLRPNTAKQINKYFFKKERKMTRSVFNEGSRMGLQEIAWGFPGGAVVENLPANAGDTGSSPGLGRSHMPRTN